MSIQDKGSLTEKVNRVEVITSKGREFVFWEKEGSVDVKIHLQDSGRTLKIFITDKP